jgi:YidC/Oxa1 family membrane protein insertase
MKKQDIVILAVLFGLWIAWPTIDREIKKRFFHSTPAPAAEQVVNPADPDQKPAAPAEPMPELAEPAIAEAPVETPAAPVVVEEPVSMTPEKTAVLENEKLKVTVSSRGAAIASAELKSYRTSLNPASQPVVLDFDAARALAYSGIDGISANIDFEMAASADGQSVRFERKAASGLKLCRTISLADGYVLRVTDELTNETAQAISVPAHSIQIGPMRNLEGETPIAGLAALGVDTLSPGGEGVKYWGGKIPKGFDTAMEEKSLPKLPVNINWPVDKPVDWVAVKNKYFAQILTPEGGGEKVTVHAVREVLPAEIADPKSSPKGATVDEISASILLPEFKLGAGEVFTRAIQYYVGPKKYSELSKNGLHQVDVMEFGMWAPVGKLLLKIMNGIHDFLWPHNYGIAIILLTILVRIVFWPITRKSTESMKKMQEIQPLVKAVQAKYKDNAQKQQQEVMALYKEHKVNPLGGCLPMLIQIPVFIALFVVLRSAIELRFAHFLWIRDLSQPENLFPGMLPFGLSLNLLPIFMAGTMFWQQKLTPSASADPNQQKIMMFMPVMMLVMFYNFAAGLALYWTTQNVLMIVQQLMMKKSKVQSPMSKA